MVDLIGDIVDFLIKSVIFKILGYILFLIFILALFIEIAYFKATGHLSLNIFFNKKVLGELAWYYKKEIALLGIAITLFYMSLALYLQNKIAKRKNCAIQEVELKQIANIWLESESYKNLIKEEVIKETKTKEPKEKKADFIIPSFKNPRSYELFDFINKNKEAFNLDGVSIISDLIKILENNPTSSVASKFKQDPNYKDYKKLVVANKTSYDILSETDLYTHTLDVVDEVIKYVNENFEKEKTIYLQRAIIAALAHDIGKIQKPLTASVTIDLFKKAPHNVISALILREKYPELDQNTIEAVEQHHGAIKDKNNYILKILLEADKKAREKEINKWLIDNKYKEPEEEKDKELDKEELEQEDNTKQEENKDKEENIEAEENDNSVTEDNIDNKKREKDNENEANNETKEQNEDIKDQEDEDVFDVDMDEIFGGSEDEEDYEGIKEKIKNEIEDKLCSIKKSALGLDLSELVFVKGKFIYIALAFLNGLVDNKELLFKKLKETKEGFVKEIEIRVFDKEYKIKVLAIKDEALEIDVSNINCDEVEIKEEE